MALKARSPFVGQVETVTSPDDPDIQFGLKRVGNREIMIHRDRNAAVRYIQRDGADEFVSEKDYPLGSMKIDTITLCLDSWNLCLDENALRPLPVTQENILAYLSPTEVDFLYEQAIEINPILGPGGKDERKND